MTSTPWDLFSPFLFPFFAYQLSLHLDTDTCYRSLLRILLCPYLPDNRVSWIEQHRFVFIYYVNSGRFFV